MAINTVFSGRIKNIHLVGIGGIGMSGIAKILLSSDFKISGSDISNNSQTESLSQMGAKIYLGHQASHVEQCDLVVYSSAININNIELVTARQKNIPIISRAVMLAELMRLRCGIAIAGAHGKTTTTSLIGTLMAHAGLDPSVIIGGVVNYFGSNSVLGKSQYMVTEADESDGTFLHLQPTIAVVTNIDLEHLDYYPGGFDELVSKFLTFLNNLPFYGTAVACIDDPHIKKLRPQIERRLVTYGIDSDAHYCIANIKHDGLSTSFDLIIRKTMIHKCVINMAGHHNVLNTVAAIAVLEELGVPCESLLAYLNQFQGVKRRFSPVGNPKDFLVIDDYAHHPTEIKAVLKAARTSFINRKIRVLFQPHRYTRTRDLMSEFATCFSDCDSLIITNIYAASELPIPGVTTETLIKNIKSATGLEAILAINLDDGTDKICKIIQPNDVVLTLGAGSVTQAGPNIINILNTKYKNNLI